MVDVLSGICGRGCCCSCCCLCPTHSEGFVKALIPLSYSIQSHRTGSTLDVARKNSIHVLPRHAASSGYDVSGATHFFAFAASYDDTQ